MVGSTRSEFRLNGAIGDKKLAIDCANGFVGSQKTTPKKIFFGTGGGPENILTGGGKGGRRTRKKTDVPENKSCPI